ncbi:hypothetical protein MANES_02G117000v8 [Manihot esculenta]|uniref:Uncharacterized protein n=1 Tax=Manihot esculenta TaxID=3983 RepID=A0ACB7IAK6_MANES|nr:hypothetical protein MANES_02G117000v8 [Manihot esculenta]
MFPTITNINLCFFHASLRLPKMSPLMMGYSKIRRRCHGAAAAGRGFRLNPKRFSVQTLRTRFFYLFKLFTTCKSSYGHAVQSLKRGMSRYNHSVRRKRSGNSKRGLVVEVSGYNSGRGDCRMRTFGRSNSFYSEAIADCLEFIKGSSLSVEQKQVCAR